MSSTRKSRLTAWLTRARDDLDRVAGEIDQMADRDVDEEPSVRQEVDDVRARLGALESRVQAIEGTTS